MRKVKWYFFRFLRGPANIVQGIVQTVTFGFVDPPWALKAECLFLDSNDC